MSDYLDCNKSAWTRWAEDFNKAGRTSWETDEISWGIWGIKESEVRALGDLDAFKGLDILEAGCGTAYFSSWFARRGANVTGIDLTPAQLDSARAFQKEFGLEFPLYEGNAESTPFKDASFDFVFSEYGASIWCDPYKWIPECARLVRPGGRLIFLTNGTISMLCMPPVGQVTTSLQRPYFGMHRFEWGDDESVEFHLGYGDRIRLLRDNGFEIENLIELQAPESDEESRFDSYMRRDFATRWPSEEIWVARKV